MIEYRTPKERREKKRSCIMLPVNAFTYTMPQLLATVAALLKRLSEVGADEEGEGENESDGIEGRRNRRGVTDCTTSREGEGQGQGGRPMQLN